MAEPTKASAPRGWHSRGYLPHCDESGAVQAITFRLADSLPAHLSADGARASPPASSMNTPTGRRDAHAPAPFEAMDAKLDAGHGACVLRRPEAARVVQDALLFADGERYRLLAWVVMPNHVHALVEVLPEVSLSTVVHSWKSFTAKQINRLLGATGRLWQPDYFDRYMRDGKHLSATVQYIEYNPVKAGLVEMPEAWPWGSAAARDR